MMFEKSAFEVSIDVLIPQNAPSFKRYDCSKTIQFGSVLELTKFRHVQLSVEDLYLRLYCVISFRL